MVRSIVGTLLKVGYGNWTTEKVREILENQDRDHAGIQPPRRVFIWCEWITPLLSRSWTLLENKKIHHGDAKNTKSESRNPKQIQNTNDQTFGDLLGSQTPVWELRMCRGSVRAV